MNRILDFPLTHSILWDHRPAGEAIYLNFNHHWVPTVILSERALRLAQRYSVLSTNPVLKFSLSGTLLTNPDDTRSITINLERFEELFSPEVKQSFIGVLNASSQIFKNNEEKTELSSNDYLDVIKILYQRCTEKKRVEAEKFISVSISCTYQENNVLHLDTDAIFPSLELKLIPVISLNILPTALSKNLSASINMSGPKNERKSGYLTMEQTRKLMLVLESDPQAHSLPLVGIWVYGVENCCDFFVWLNCLRYLYNANIKRFCAPPDPFLILLYSPLQSKPCFFECTLERDEQLDFSLYSCHESVQLSKMDAEHSRKSIEISLYKVKNGLKCDLFQSARQTFLDLKSGSSVSSKATSEIKSEIDNKPNLGKKNGPFSKSHLEDVLPRNSPAPHLTKVSHVQHVVPEVSLIFDDSTKIKRSSTQSKPFIESPCNLKTHHRPGKPQKINENHKMHTKHDVHVDKTVLAVTKDVQSTISKSTVHNKSKGPNTKKSPINQLKQNDQVMDPVLSSSAINHNEQKVLGQSKNKPMIIDQSKTDINRVFDENNRLHNSIQCSAGQAAVTLESVLDSDAHLMSNHLTYNTHPSYTPPVHDKISQKHCKFSDSDQLLSLNHQQISSSINSNQPEPVLLHKHEAAEKFEEMKSPFNVQNSQISNNSIKNLVPEFQSNALPQNFFNILQNQEQQLNLLKEQLSELLAKQKDVQLQNSSSVKETKAVATQYSPPSTPNKEGRPKFRSTGINTSLLSAECFSYVKDSLDENNSCVSHNKTVNTDKCSSTNSGENPLSDYNTTQEVSTDHFSSEMNIIPEFDRTEESLISDFIVDLPDYTSLSPEKLANYHWDQKSPQFGESVSMYLSESSKDLNNPVTDLNNSSVEKTQEAENLQDQNQNSFYQNFIEDVKKLLQNHYSDQKDDEINSKLNPEKTLDVEKETKIALENIGVDFKDRNGTSLSSHSDQTVSCFDAALLPKIQYVSMILGRDLTRDSNDDIDALAMKYLSDASLVKFAHKLRYDHDPLDSKQSLNIDLNTQETMADMSFASKKYLQRYGLINDDGSRFSLQNHSNTKGHIESTANKSKFGGSTTYNACSFEKSSKSYNKETSFFSDTTQFHSPLKEEDIVDKNTHSHSIEIVKNRPHSLSDVNTNNILDIKRLRTLPKLL